MATNPVCEEGKALWKIPSTDELCSTYYKVVGDLSSGKTPVVILHGGPGAGHEYLLTFSDLWPKYGLPVIFYDQIGCASSTHIRQKAGDEAFWQEQLFQDELDHLIDHLGLRIGPGFKVGNEYLSRTHVCRTEPLPAELLQAFQNIKDDSTVYSTMMGPTYLLRGGSLKSWTVVSRLSNITAPTLVVNGEYDTSHDVAQAPLFELIPRVRWVQISGGGHMCHVEGEGRRDRVLKVVGDFLTGGS
ncbi:proline iminopeptidase [Apiospora phragmitis]|uniref:Proline iminopeptidase n=1 Tax=Apiospora phragmitis TaxID=2905665 RepID=A0ABR1WAT3_9PEZI